MVLLLLYYYYSKKKARETEKKVREKDMEKNTGKKYGENLGMRRTYFRDVTAGESEKKYRKPQLPVAHVRTLPPLWVTSFPVKTSEKRAAKPNFRLRTPCTPSSG